MAHEEFDREAFVARRQQLVRRRARSSAPAALASGWARPRNFAHNVYPFRAESHFLYFVGQHIEGALLVMRGDSVTLYVEPPDPEIELWEGRAPGLDELEERLGLCVRPLEDLAVGGAVACLPPQDEETAAWMAALLNRPVEAQGGPELRGDDAELADAVVACRLRHDEASIVQLRQAASGSADAHVAAMQAVRAAPTEAAVLGTFVGALIAAGLTPGYDPIVTTRGEILHAKESDAPLTPGQLLLCDVGGETRQGQTGDITRTFPTSGRFSSTQRDIYQAVLFVQESAIDSVQPGAEFRQLHLGALRAMAEALSELGILRGEVDTLVETGAASVFFPHGLGHLLGVDVHDMEDLGDRAGYEPGVVRSTHPAEAPLRLSRRLEAGMCVTIEPGFYRVPLLLERAKKDGRVAPLIDWQRLDVFEDVRGIRVEDDVLVTPQGNEVLSAAAPKDVATIEEVIVG